MNTKNYYVYLTTNLANGKNYVGKHFGEINDTYMGSGRYISNAFKKYGMNNFYKIILDVCDSLEELNKKEIEYIKYYRSIGKAEYNIADGGEGGNLGEKWYKRTWDACHNQEYSHKLSKALMGHETSEKRKQKISETLKKYHDEGKIKVNDWSKGRHWYNDGVKNISAFECPEGCVKGRLQLPPLTSEVRNKISIANKGKKRTEETKRRMSKANKGRIITEEQRNRISNTLKIKYNTIHRYWYTNGKVNTLAEICPEGFYRGRTLKKESIEIMVNAMNRGKKK